MELSSFPPFAPSPTRTLDLYVNGALVGDIKYQPAGICELPLPFPQCKPSYSNATRISIGFSARNAFADEFSFHGLIDDVSLYDCPLRYTLQPPYAVSGTVIGAPRGMRCAELKRAGVRCAVLTWAIVSFEDIATLADNSRVCTASQAQNCSVSLPPTLSLSCCSLALPLSHTLPLPPLSVLPWPSLSITLSSLSPRLRSHTHTRSLLLALSPALSRCTTDVFLPRLSQEFAYCERVDGVPTCTCRPGQSTMVLRLSS
eukprot:2437314-Rhodomonas_salina.1